MHTLALEDIVNPIDLKGFISNYLGQEFLYLSGNSGKFSSLLSWRALSSLIAYHQIDGARLRLVRNGEIIPRTSYSRYEARQTYRMPYLVGREFACHLREGATIVLDGIDWLYEPISRMAEQLERTLECVVHVNMYAGWRESPCLDLHWDRHDVLVLQIEGTKRWQVYGQTRRHPLNADVEETPRPKHAPIWEGVLQSGDILYLPRGWWHQATPCGEPTLHLTVGLKYPNGSDLLSWLGHELKRTEIMRRDLPICGSAEEKQLFWHELRHTLLDSCQDIALLERYLNELNDHAAPRTHISFPFCATGALPDSDDLVVWPVSPRNLHIGHLGDGLIEVRQDGQSYRFRAEAVPLLECIQNGTPVVIREFYRRFDGLFPRLELQQFLTDLLNQGLICIKERTGE
jgi:hypothetical protein